MITVNGRVRATVRLKADTAPEGAGATCVVASTWASNRPFPRTAATGVAFELETADGEIYGVDPFEALLALPVRRRETDGDTRAEAAWIGHGDEVTVEGDLRRGGRGAPKQIVHALRLATLAATSVHRVPPRALSRGEAEKVEVPREVAATATATPTATVAAATTPAATETAVTDEPATTAGDASTSPSASSPGTEGPTRKPPKKKRPDSSGTPTPIQ
jgi:hypothetical protein